MTRHDIYAGVQQRKRHGDAPGVRSPRKRRAGARRGSAPLAVLLALVMALAFPARARADGVLPSSGWQPFTFYSQDRGADGTFYCVTNSASDFNTALHLIGRMSDYLQLSNEQLAKLSNEGSGGRFYQLAKSFESAAGWNEDTNLPHEWSVAMGAVDAAGILYGHSNTWWGTVTDELLQGAKTDYMVIYNGGSLGGGSDADYYYYTGNVHFIRNTSGSQSGNYIQGDGIRYTNNLAYKDRYTLLPTSITVRIDRDLLNEQYTWSGGACFLEWAGGYITYLGLWTNNFTKTEANNTVEDNGQVYVDNNYISSVGGSPYSWVSSGIYTTGTAGTSTKPASYDFDGSVLTIRRNYGTNKYGVDSGTWSRNANYAQLILVGGGGSGGGGGDNNWPGPTDEPEPGPPEPPREPTDPVGGPIDWPEPYNPTTPAPGPEPTPTTPVSNPTNTSPADYTPWFMAILSELRGIHTDVNAWLDAIFEGIIDYGAAICSHIDTASENVRSTLRFMTQWMDEQLDSSFYQLRHLLWECANYIADSLDYTFVGPDVNVPGYDDSSVLYWLKRIYYKLGSGNVNTRPVDPVADHDNWWDWIVQLIKNLILDLGMMGADFLSDMGDVLSEVVQKFPFSIPWDIAAYLTAFSTQPVTPVIVITIPAMSGFLPQIQWTIDLHPYDDAMATVRACETIVFAFWLMWKCPMLLDMMDTAKWGI